MIKKFKLKIFLLTFILLSLPFYLLFYFTVYGSLHIVEFANTNILRTVTQNGLSIINNDNPYTNEDLIQKSPIYHIDLNTYEIESTNSEYDEQIISTNIDYIIKNNRPKGSINSYFYFYDKENNAIAMRDLTFFRASYDLMKNDNNHLKVFAAVILILIAVAKIITYFICKPVETAFNRQKQFINDASHELKTPLSIISLNLELLPDSSKQSIEYEYMHSEVKRMDRLIKDLLESSRGNDFNIKLNKKNEDISNALYEIALPLESIAFEKGINMDINIDENIYHKVDIEKLKQVFVILIDNAIKYTNNDNKIEINLTKNNRKLTFEVTNYGVTIPKEYQKYIFDRFYQLDKSRSENKGYGLGLSIAKDIINKHCGKITLTSIDNKTTFKVVL